MFTVVENLRFFCVAVDKNAVDREIARRTTHIGCSLFTLYFGWRPSPKREGRENCVLVKRSEGNETSLFFSSALSSSVCNHHHQNIKLHHICFSEGEGEYTNESLRRVSTRLRVSSVVPIIRRRRCTR